MTPIGTSTLIVLGFLGAFFAYPIVRAQIVIRRIERMRELPSVQAGAAAQPARATI